MIREDAGWEVLVDWISEKGFGQGIKSIVVTKDDISSSAVIIGIFYYYNSRLR